MCIQTRWRRPNKCKQVRKQHACCFLFQHTVSRRRRVLVYDVRCVCTYYSMDDMHMWGWSWNETRRLYVVYTGFSVNCIWISLWKERKGKLCMVMEGIENINMLLIFSWKITRFAEVLVSKISVWLCDSVTVVAVVHVSIPSSFWYIRLSVSFIYFYFASLFSFCHK